MENNLRALAEVEAVPELLWLVDALPSFILLSAVPILIISFVTGCLFATCGIMGAKANSECCACCYCCCNACYCLGLVAMLAMAGAFLHQMSLASGTAQLWFARCDPKICYPLGYETRLSLGNFFDSFSRILGGGFIFLKVPIRVDWDSGSRIIRTDHGTKTL